MAHKPNLETNKIFAAILVAGVVAMLAGFVAKKLVQPEELEEPAVKIDTAALGGTGGEVATKAPEAEPILALLASADIERGQKLSKACAACHSFDKGGPDLVGPHQWNIVGRKMGSVSGFAYSDTLMAMGAEGKTWDYQSLNAFLWKPKNFVAGTKMNYIGIKKPEDRAALIAWLRTMADSPAPLPSAAEIAAEAPEPEATDEAPTDTAATAEVDAPETAH